MQGLLEECRLNVHAVANGALALERARRVNCDLMLMDFQMPVMEGISATPRIRNLQNNPQVPIPAFTANVFPEDEARCRKAEALYVAMLAALAP